MIVHRLGQLWLQIHQSLAKQLKPNHHLRQALQRVANLRDGHGGLDFADIHLQVPYL
jgi:hypothetical protein